MILVREARAEDIPFLHEFNLRLAKETEDIELDREHLEKGLKALFADPVKGQYFVAEDADRKEVVGCLSVTYEWSDWRNGTVWWMQSVYVNHTHRKKGVFRLMFDDIMKRVNDNPSIRGLRLYADKSNAAAHKTYEAMGMNGDHYRVFEIMK
ncbi:unnamed protein product [Calypogeia fissa]